MRTGPAAADASDSRLHALAARTPQSVRFASSSSMPSAPRTTDLHRWWLRAAGAPLLVLLPWAWQQQGWPSSLGDWLDQPAWQWLQLPWLLSALGLAALLRRSRRERVHWREQLYATAYRTLPDAAGITSLRDGRFLDVNPAFCRLLGLPREQIVGRTNAELDIYATPHERPRLLAALQAHGHVERLRVTTQRNGVAIPGYISAHTLQLQDEPCMVFVFHDVTEEERARGEQQALNGLLQQAGRLAQLGTWEERRGQGLVYWSEVCYDIHGLARHAPMPRNYLEQFVPAPWNQLLRDKLRQCLRTGRSWSAEIEIRRADGRMAWMRCRGEAVRDAQGGITGIRGVIQDIDQFRQAQDSLQHSEARFARLFELVPAPMALALCRDGRFKMLNPAWEALTGLPRADQLERHGIELGLVTAERWQHLQQLAARQQQALDHVELTLTPAGGPPLTVLMSLRRTRVDGEEHWLITANDITARKRQEEQVVEREALLALTLSAAALGRWDWDLETGMLSGDPQWRQLHGLQAEAGDPGTALPQRHWTELLTTQDVPRVNSALLEHLEQPSATLFDVAWRIKPPHASERWLRNLGKAVAFDTLGRPLRMLGVSLDVTPQREREHSLQQLAHFDSLTGLANRIQLSQRLQECLQHARQSGGQMAVVYLDLDGFKPVNDQLGHEAGDQLLVLVAKRLARALRRDDCVGRLGGDEFVILLQDLQNREHCESLLRRLMDSVAAPYALESERVHITVSMGYTLFPEDDTDENTLVRHADQAMYQAKQAGRNCFRAFDAGQDRQQRDQQAQSLRLREALELGEFTLFLQPKMDLVHQRLVGAEALARWRHPVRGLLPPSAFLPLIEGSELEVPFGNWVVAHALGQAQQLHERGLDLPISVNISARHLQQPGFAEGIRAALARHPQLPARRLDLEITESAALYDVVHVAAELQQLRSLGVTVSLDDFGTGYSSLTYLRRLPLDMLKIDQSFVREMIATPPTAPSCRG